MVRVLRVGIVVVLVASAVTLSGCLFNVFQTARTVGAGNVTLAVGAGFFDLSVNEDHNWSITPQARLTIGLADGLDLGVHTGALIPLETGDPGWLGAIGDLKFSLFDAPNSFSLALGFGGGYGLEFGGFGVFGEVFFDSNVRILPIFIAYRPIVPLGAAEFTLWHHIAGGVKLALSESARLLIEIDTLGQLISFGIALEIGF